MSKSQYSILEIDEKNAKKIALDLFGINGAASVLPGELDFNFKIATNSESFILKISRPNVDKKFIEFQVKLLDHISQSDFRIIAPGIIMDIEGNTISKITDTDGNERLVRLYTWIDGRLWSSVNPNNYSLLYSLGKEAGLITKILQDFDHPIAHREFEWDICQAEWTLNYVNLFEEDVRKIIEYFQRSFTEILPKLKSLRHGVIHNDANDNNIIVTADIVNPTVKAIIDYGDAIYTSVINNLAVTIAYAVMGKPDPLQAAFPVIKGYNEQFPLKEEELKLLYVLVAMRLVISLTKSAVNKQKEPDNEYLQISSGPAKRLLQKWYEINSSRASYSFKKACGYMALPDENPILEIISSAPDLLRKKTEFEKPEHITMEKLLSYRKEHLGKSLSLSYDKPLKIVRGSGVFLIDDTGRKYLDTVNNVAHVGHEHPRVVKAGQEQMALLNTNTRYLHDHIVAFATELLETFPEKLSVVHFVNSGSEANELALRMAKTYTGQKDMIAIEMGYHGNTNACIDISSYKFDRKGGEGCPEYTHIVPMPDAYRGIYQGKNTGEKYAAHILDQIKSIMEKDRGVAAFICESIMSCGGQIELPENYLRQAYYEIRKAGGVCIADEVQVGCGRVGSAFWAFQLYDVIPDIVTIGKPIGNGHPLAAVVCTKEVADAFANGMEYFNTFGGNPVSCAIGLEVLRVIKEEKWQENALIVGNYLKEQLLKLQVDFPIIGDVRGQGLFLGFELNGKNKIPLGEKATYLANRMKDFGILMSTDGPDHNVLKIKPPMVFSTENTDELIMRLRTVFKEDFMRLDSII